MRSYAALAIRAAQLHQLAKDEFYLYLNAKVHRDARSERLSEPLWELMLPAARHQAAMWVVRKFGQCSRLLGFMVQKGIFEVVPESVGRVLMSMQPFLTRLWQEGMTEAARYYEEVLENMAAVAIDIAKDLEEWQGLALLTKTSVWLGNCHDQTSVARRHKWAEIRAKEIGNAALREQTLAELQAASDAIQSLAQGGAPQAMDTRTEKQIYEGMAASLGIDLSDPDDEIAQVVRIGIEDLDPTRVLRNCCHLYVVQSGGGLPAAVLKLPTAGFKTLYCTLHGWGIGALRLDDAYTSLQRDHCSACNDKTPRPQDWHWTHEWQAKQFKLHGERFEPL